ncbi:pentatricopeptide repeat-containing protein At1g08070, chloroplastic-like [Amborella trichopoda]|uniref:pentatricopeptide repeat-containing protein At1g08070, chloroplastic-like n=1 Tax=Amborella trichopoda TaxID=13333 RepID=UPI0005D3213A|nr:pentatricopeptide repeat-containing protein At1g08070, chloroplastic-like [Amborella trichopoda]|eukprot:XP_011622992.1 pentatricopeptide repeat-containing protein At1g08070, chloroplastic-like [Amborella trichopoda]
MFELISERDIVLWTTMVSGLVQNGLANESLKFFSGMHRQNLKPNQITLTSALSACSHLKILNLGKSIHGFSLRHKFKGDLILETALLDMYIKCKGVNYAQHVFNSMPKRNVISWNTLISGYAANGLHYVALQLFSQMIQLSMEQHNFILDNVEHPNFSHNEQPNIATLATVLQACAGTCNLRRGREVHGYIERCMGDCVLGTLLGNALIDMYVKCGDLNSGALVFKGMYERNVASWTSIIMGYGMNGLSMEALATFDKMVESGVLPDGVTFIAILSACSHAGLVDHGREMFVSMQRDYGIAPEMKHYACMVDLYGRCGFLERAYEFIKVMPIEPSEIIWAALLAVCRSHGNLELGEYAAKKALKFDRYNAGYHILLSRIYADLGRWEDFAMVRLEMKELGLKQVTGYSWVEVNRKLHMFTVGDCKHPYSQEIFGLLESLMHRMKQAGFVPNTSAVCHDINEEEKASVLCGHCEKLALAFALLKSGGEAPVRIGKNLRVCRDCHETFKYVSKIRQREIVLRDPNRYHHFREGRCSCGDFW